MHRSFVRALCTSIALVAVVLCFGCRPDYLTHNSLNVLQKGMLRGRVDDELNMSPKRTSLFTQNGVRYIMDMYPLQTAQTKTTSTNTTYTGYSQVTTRTTTTTDYLHTCIMLYAGDALRYWGMMGDFSKSDDPEIAALAPLVYTKFFQESE
jgi:hypothetical protein